MLLRISTWRRLRPTFTILILKHSNQREDSSRLRLTFQARSVRISSPSLLSLVRSSPSAFVSLSFFARTFHGTRPCFNIPRTAFYLSLVVSSVFFVDDALISQSDEFLARNGIRKHRHVLRHSKTAMIGHDRDAHLSRNQRGLNALLAEIETIQSLLGLFNRGRCLLWNVRGLNQHRTQKEAVCVRSIY